MTNEEKVVAALEANAQTSAALQDLELTASAGQLDEVELRWSQSAITPDQLRVTAGLVEAALLENNVAQLTYYSMHPHVEGADVIMRVQMLPPVPTPEPVPEPEPAP